MAEFNTTWYVLLKFYTGLSFINIILFITSIIIIP